jgi:RNA polymerase sigma-70 factor (family 1)
MFKVNTKDNISSDTALRIDHDSFETLYTLFSKKVYRICLRDIGDEDAAANIVHNIFLNIWENRNDLILDKPENYLVRSAKLQVLNYFRDKKSDERHFQLLRTEQQDHNFDTEETVRYRELRRRVDSLVLELPKQCRRVYQMRDTDGKNTGQIAQELQISKSAVKQQIGKAVFFLRARLER